MVLVILLGFLASATNYSQTSTSAVLQGTVTATDGSAIPRANIELIHVPTGNVRRASAGDNGFFFMAGLRVGGPFTLKVSHIGFATQIRTGLYLRSLENTVVNITLRQIALKGDEVVVTGDRFDTTNRNLQGGSLFVGRTQMEMLPLPSATLEDAYRLSPYMTGQNAVGFNATYNDISLDGIGIADQYGLQHRENLPGSMQGSPLSLESIQELRVDLSPFDVRRSGFTGAAISAVSRSGSNTFSGSAYGEGTGGWGVGRNPDDGRLDIRGYADSRAGFRISGPIVTSRAFFFATGEMSAIRLPVERRFDATTTLGTTYSFPSFFVDQLRSRLQTAYGYEPSRMDAVTLNRESTNFFARLDVNVRRGHRLSVRYNLLDYESDRPPYGPTVYAEGTLARNSIRVHSAIAELASVLSPKVSNELLIGFTARRFTSTPQDMPFPFVDVTVIDRRQWWNHLTVGSEVGGDGEQLSQNHLEVHNNTSIMLRDHLMTFGVQGDYHWFTDRLLSYGWGRYAFPSVSAFLASQSSEYEYRYFADSASNAGVKWGALQFGALWQDEWRVSPALTVSLGVRADLPVFPDHPKENAAVRDTFLPLGYDVFTSSVPMTRVLLSPRIGFSANFEGNRSVHVRGGVGLFTGRIPYAWIGNLYDHTGVDNRHIKVSANAPAFVADPTKQPTPAINPGLAETTEIVVIDRNFVMPQEVRWTIGMDMSLPWNLLLSFEGVYSRTVSGVVFKNINLKPFGTLGPALGGDERTVYGLNLPGQWVYSRYDNRFTDVIYMSNGDGGETTFLTVQLQRRPAGDGTFGSFSYSFGSTKDLNSGGWDNAYDQWRYNPAEEPNQPRLNYSAFDRTHRVTAGFSYSYEWSPGWAASVGLVYTGTSGMPYSYVYDGDHNGDGESLNDLFYVPSNYSEILFVNRDGDLAPPDDPAYNQLFGFIAHDEYLRTHRGQVCERNGARCPWAHQLDVRLAQTLPLVGSSRLEISADLLNVLNMLNKSWGLVQYVPYQVVPVLQFYKTDNIGRPWYRWAPRTAPFVADPLFSRWRIKVGMKFTF